jgi:SAM-dependent methyltransferase
MALTQVPLASNGAVSGAAALAAYEAFAPIYDRFTASYSHEAWLANLDRLARSHGVSRGRLLDVACGTGKSFLPMLARGWDVTACDLSPAMVERARAKLDGRGRERVFVADMRALPDGIGEFDLVTCLNDAVNYLLTPGDLTRAVCSMGAVLRPGGLLLFDVNARAAYRAGFDDEVIESGDDVEFTVSGGPAPELDGLYEVVIDAVERRSDGPARHHVRELQRHHDFDTVEHACGEAGLELADVLGQVPGGRLVRPADEDLHPKVLYVARRPGGIHGRGGA